MANPEHVEVVRQGAAAVKEWRKNTPIVSLDLSNADLSECDLADMNLSGARMMGTSLVATDGSHTLLALANLSKANLYGVKLAFANLMLVDFSQANLRRADLGGANLGSADFSSADLTEADLNGANLWGADFTNANLLAADLTSATLFGTDVSGANLDGVTMGCTSLGRCDLSRCVGLGTVLHRAPSSVSVDTLLSSLQGAGGSLTGALSTFFLGAGVPTKVLGLLPSILDEIQYCSCYIIYGTPDQPFAEKLRSDLLAGGVSCWVYCLDSSSENPIKMELADIKQDAEKFVFLCSHYSVAQSEFLYEVEDDVAEDPSKVVAVFVDDLGRQPNSISNGDGPSVIGRLMEGNYADFSDPAKYGEALERLLNGLRREK